MSEPTTPLPRLSTASDEATTIAEFVEYYRTVFLRKTEGVDDSQVRTRVAASTLDLLGLVRHMAEVERYWFREVFTNETVPELFCNEADPDGDFHHTAQDTMAMALASWTNEVDRSRAIAAAASPGDIGANLGTRRGPVSMRWIMIHMLEEYARHCGHADLLREAIDGVTED